MASPHDNFKVPDLLQRMADAVPTHPKDDDSSDIASSYEVVALLVHAFLTSLDFKLQGFHENKTLRECETLYPRLPAEWNNSFGALSFVYRHKQSSMTFVVRVDRMGSKVEVRGLAIGDEKIYSVQREIRDVVDSKALPIRMTMKDGEEDRSDLVAKLSKAFWGEGGNQKIINVLEGVQIEIVQRFIPKLQKDGYKEYDAKTSTEPTRNDPRQDDHPRHGANYLPRPAQPAIPAGHRPGPVPDFPPPDFEDEHHMNRPPAPMVLPGQSPFNIGHDDLNPQGLGPHDPLRGSFVGGGLPRPGGGGGMHPTFDDPLFTGQGVYGGQRGYDPQNPPGARWDPIGPGGDPRFPGPGMGMGRGNDPFGSPGGYGGDPRGNGRGNNQFGGGYGGGFGGGFGGDII